MRILSSKPSSSPQSKSSPISRSSGKPTSKEVQQRIDRLVADYRKELEQKFGVSDKLLTLDQVEDAALNIREKVGQAVAEEMTQAQVDAAETAEDQQKAHKANCQQCHRSRAYRGSGERTIVTMAGDVHVKRRVYHCGRCKHCTMPIDTELSLPQHRFSAKVEQWVARLCVKDTFERAMEELQELARVQVSAKEAQRISLAVGKHVQQSIKEDVAQAIPRHRKCVHLRGRNPEALAPQQHTPTLTGYVSMDGVMVPMDSGRYEEAKVGHVELVQHTPLTEQGVRTSSNAQRDYTQPGRVLNSLYTFHLGGPDECAEQTYALAARAGITELSRLVFVADGAEWIWRRAKRYFPGAIEILDWYHAVEHLSAVVKTCVGAQMTAIAGTGNQSGLQKIDEDILKAQCASKVEQAKTLMWEGKVRELLRCLKKLPQVTEEARESVRQTVQYYRKNRTRMRYNRYRAQGLRIGSGSMESACKQVVTARLKGAGMRWCQQGAQAMGHLRSLYLSTARWAEVVGQWPGRRLLAVPSC